MTIMGLAQFGRAGIAHGAGTNLELAFLLGAEKLNGGSMSLQTPERSDTEHGEFS